MFLLRDQASVRVKREAKIRSVQLKSSFDTHEHYQHNANRANMQIKQLHRQNAHEEGQKKKKNTPHQPSILRLSYGDMHIYIRTHPKTFRTSYLRIVKIR